MTVIEEVAAERSRQISEEGWHLAHDDVHVNGEMAGAAACYALNGVKIRNPVLNRDVMRLVPDLWPWAKHWWKPKSRRQDLIRAAALIVAEIERLDRTAQPSDTHREAK